MCGRFVASWYQLIRAQSFTYVKKKVYIVNFLWNENQVKAQPAEGVRLGGSCARPDQGSIDSALCERRLQMSKCELELANAKTEELHLKQIKIIKFKWALFNSGTVTRHTTVLACNLQGSLPGPAIAN